MNKYTIYCTEEQTRKALELGAPIEQTPMTDMIRDEIGKSGFLVRNLMYWLPTAEQMIGWLEEQCVLVDINPINGLHFYWMLRTKELDEGSGKYMWECQYRTPEVDSEYNSRKEVTLAAIDAALDYLSKIKLFNK